MHTPHTRSRDRDPLAPIPFPIEQAARATGFDPDRVLAEVDGMSRRIEDLARALRCPSHFGDDDPPPRAA